MKKLDKFFITTLVAGLGLFTSALTPIEPVQALIGTNQIENNAITSPKIKDGEVKTNDLATAAVTKEKLNPNAVKLVVIPRLNSFAVPARGSAFGESGCNADEIASGGGYTLPPGGLVGTVHVGQSVPLSGGWAIAVGNDGDDAITVRVIAECAHLELGP